MGWVGEKEEILHALKDAGADEDAEGAFLLAKNGSRGLVSFLGLNQEFVVDDLIQYFVNGEAKSLADLLCEKTGRKSITVI